MGPWTVALEADPDPEVHEAIAAALQEHNVAAVGRSDYHKVAVTVRGPDGAVAGGLWGRTSRGFLIVELLALGPARGRGLGREVMALAEAEARRLGLSGMWLDTFTFQAPDFYPRFGFVEFGRITDHLPGHDRIFYVKRFD